MDHHIEVVSLDGEGEEREEMTQKQLREKFFRQHLLLNRRLALVPGDEVMAVYGEHKNKTFIITHRNADGKIFVAAKDNPGFPFPIRPDDIATVEDVRAAREAALQEFPQSVEEMEEMMSTAMKNANTERGRAKGWVQ